MNPAAVSPISNEIEFTWDNNSDDINAMENDKVLLVVYNPSKQYAITVVGGNTRVGCSQIITLLAIQCYIVFQNATSKFYPTASLQAA